MEHRTAPGLFDIIPNDPKESWHNSHLWNFVEATVRSVMKNYGFQEIRTPIFERTELFEKGTGKESDIVTKEMYTFKDKGNRSITLRPEGTPPVLRAFIERKLQSQAPIHKLFYIGPMFRYERPQAGRYRQHHQFGAEAIGNASPEQDAEIIDMLCTIFSKLGLTNLTLHLNSLGNENCRSAFHEALCRFLEPQADKLSADSQRRLKTNPLRILDSKEEQDRKIIVQAPMILDFLDKESHEHFEGVKKRLDSLGIAYEVDPLLVRGLDYYNKTVFEITSGELGAQNSVGGGGRYDGLMKQLGGPDLPTMGFACGLERVIQTLIKQEVPYPESPKPTVFMIGLGDKAYDRCFSLLHDLRQEGVSAQMDFTGKKLSKVMQYAHNLGARYTMVIGDTELEQEAVDVKEMESGESQKIQLEEVIRFFKRKELREEPLHEMIHVLMENIVNLLGGLPGGGTEGVLQFLQNLVLGSQKRDYSQNGEPEDEDND